MLGEEGYAWAGDRALGCRIIGRISMDLLAVDLRDGGFQRIQRCRAASEQTEAQLRQSRLAKAIGSALNFDLPGARRPGLSQYELLTTLGSRFKRIWR